MVDPTGILEEALERNLLKVEHDHPFPLLDITSGEVQGHLFNLDKTRMEFSKGELRVR